MVVPPCVEWCSMGKNYVNLHAGADGALPSVLSEQGYDLSSVGGTQLKIPARCCYHDSTAPKLTLKSEDRQNAIDVSHGSPCVEK